MPKSPDEYSSPQEPLGNSGEKPGREAFKLIAKVQMSTLGYSDLRQQLSDILQNKGELGKLAKSKPHMVGGIKENFYVYAGRMQRVPNIEEAVNLLQTAIFGEPIRRDEDGTTTVTSFDIAEPSSTTTQSKVLMLRDEQNDTRFVPNIKGTDKLVRNLIFDTGFQHPDKIEDIIFQLNIFQCHQGKYSSLHQHVFEQLLETNKQQMRIDKNKYHLIEADMNEYQNTEHQNDKH